MKEERDKPPYIISFRSTIGGTQRCRLFGESIMPIVGKPVIHNECIHITSPHGPFYLLKTYLSELEDFEIRKIRIWTDSNSILDIVLSQFYIDEHDKQHTTPINLIDHYKMGSPTSIVEIEQSIHISKKSWLEFDIHTLQQIHIALYLK